MNLIDVSKFAVNNMSPFEGYWGPTISKDGQIRSIGPQGPKIGNKGP